MKFTKREMPPNENGTGGVFLKLKDGESKIGIFRGEVLEFYQVWDNGKSKLVHEDYPGAKSRFRLNFVTREDGELKAKIFEFPLGIYNQLAALSEDYDLEKTGVKITRRGTGKETIYMIIPAKEQPDNQQLNAIGAIPLNILVHKEGPALPVKRPNVPNHASPHTNENVPWPEGPTDEQDEIPF